MANTPSPPVFYDCEATGLRGFPIEIGWAYCDPAGRRITMESHLLRPASDWNLADAWETEAEDLHQISQAEIAQFGELTYTVALAMNQALSGRELFADSGADLRWITMLFGAAGLDFGFEVRRTLAGVYFNQLIDRAHIPPDQLSYILKEADRIAPHTHRAATDAANWAWRLALLYRYAQFSIQNRSKD